MTTHTPRLLLGLTTACTLLLSAAELGAQQGTRPAPRRPTSAQMAAARPDNAAMKCKDGTYQTSTSATACDTNGGILLRYPPKATPPAAKTLDRGRPRTAEDEKRLMGDSSATAQPIRKP